MPRAWSPALKGRRLRPAQAQECLCFVRIGFARDHHHDLAGGPNLADELLALAVLHVELPADVLDGVGEFVRGFVAVNPRQPGICREVPPFRGGLENALDDIFKDAPVVRLALTQGGFAALMAADAFFQFPAAPLQGKLAVNLAGERCQRLLTLRVQHARPLVEDRQQPDDPALRRPDGSGGQHRHPTPVRFENFAADRGGLHAVQQLA